MSGIFVLTSGIAEDPGQFAQDARYRKATRNMILANSSVEKALSQVPQEIVLNDCGLVLGSCHGELSVTMNFLKTMAETGVARPILFQNSLHNSTTGFVTMTWKISGPMVTVSGLHFTGEDALETAICLLRQGSCRFCLVTTVEARVTELVDGLKETKLRSQYIGEGSATILLCNQDGLSQLDRKPICELISVSSHREPTQTFVEPPNYYESNAVECLARAFGTNEHSLLLSKPDGSTSQFAWR